MVKVTERLRQEGKKDFFQVRVIARYVFLVIYKAHAPI